MVDEKDRSGNGVLGGLIIGVVSALLLLLVGLGLQSADRIHQERELRALASARGLASVVEVALADPFGPATLSGQALSEWKAADPAISAAAIVQEEATGGEGGESGGSALSALMASLGGKTILAHTDPALVGQTLSGDGGGEGAFSQAEVFKRAAEVKDHLTKNAEARAANPTLPRNPYREVVVLPVEQGLFVMVPVLVSGELKATVSMIIDPPMVLPVSMVPLASGVGILFLAVGYFLSRSRPRGVPLLVLLLIPVLVGVFMTSFSGTTQRLVEQSSHHLSSLSEVWTRVLTPALPSPPDVNTLATLLNLGSFGDVVTRYTSQNGVLVPTPGAFALHGLAGPWPLLLSAGITLLWGIAFMMGRVQRMWQAFVDHWFAYAYIAPAMAGMILLVFSPFVYGLSLSVFERIYGEFEFVGLSNFFEILGNLTLESGFYFTFAVTVLWTVANVVLHVSIGLGLALLLKDKSLKGTAIYRTLLIVPWAVPNYITALIWKGLFHKQFGAINGFLALLGFEPVSWFDTFWRAFAANLATNTWLGFPFMMVVSLGALQSIPTDLYEAADVDGAGRWDKFWRITVPLLKPALFPAIILGIIWTFNMFNVIYLVSGGAPDGKTDILITEAYRWAFERGRYGYAAAYSTIIFTILVTYTVITNRLTRATAGAYE